jgi:hypothetical protein
MPRRFVATFVIGTLILVPTEGSKAQTMVGAATFGAALLIGLNKAGDLIRQAREAGNDLLLGTGVEIQNAITTAQIAYADSLNLTMQQVSDAERKFAADMDNVFQTNIDKGAHAAHDLLEKTQIIANTIPFASKIPQLAGYSPHFLLPALASFRVDISGNFPFGFNQDEFPVMTVGGQTIKSSSFGTTFMSFNVPKALCGQVPSNTLTPCSAQVSIPWDASRWYNVFGRKVEHGIFKIELEVLPASPGKMVLTVPITTPQPQVASRVSGNFLYDSSDNDIEENRSLHLSQADIQDGWRIIPNTWRFELVQHIEGVEGHDWYNMGYQTSSDVEVVWRARTERKHAGSSGKIVWRIACNVGRTVQVPSNVQTNVPLTWDMSQNFRYPPGWKLTWTRFDNAKHDFTKTDLDNSLLRVSATGTDFTVITFGQAQ